jgi:hypothetical protein
VVRRCSEPLTGLSASPGRSRGWGNRRRRSIGRIEGVLRGGGLERRGRGGLLIGPARAVRPFGGQAAQPLETHAGKGRPSHQVRGRSLGCWACWLCGGVSLNTLRSRLALSQGPGSHLQSPIPGAPTQWNLVRFVRGGGASTSLLAIISPHKRIAKHIHGKPIQWVRRLSPQF